MAWCLFIDLETDSFCVYIVVVDIYSSAGIIRTDPQDSIHSKPVTKCSPKVVGDLIIAGWLSYIII